MEERELGQGHHPMLSGLLELRWSGLLELRRVAAAPLCWLQETGHACSSDTQKF